MTRMCSIMKGTGRTGGRARQGAVGKQEPKLNRQEAGTELKRTFGLDKFHDGQWETIDMLFQGKRVLLIEKTGFGKSLCFQFPATQFEGVTVIFSPLIALMRDQAKGLNAKGIRADFISPAQSLEENRRTIQDTIDGKIKILYIAPERQENPEWAGAARKINISVLATTATATKRVQLDIENQISGDIKTIRGRLIRENFGLYVIKVRSEDEKLLWLAENIGETEGTGIIYAGTRNNTEIYSRWLGFLGIKASEYHAGLDTDARTEVEQGLMDNKWKAVVSTDALGMGIDKGDIRFIVHTQIPASPIHYYQEIGRAGRDGRPTKLVLFYNTTKDDKGVEEDYKLPKAFIDGGRPAAKDYQKVIHALKQEQLSESELMKKTNLKQTPARVIKADLIDQGIVKEVIYGKSKKYEYLFNAPGLNTKKFDELRKLKLEELDAMLGYVNLEGPRMEFLCDYLGDTAHTNYQNCDNTNLRKYTLDIKEETKGKLAMFRENYFPELKVKTRDSNIVNGIASSFYGVSNVGATLHRSKYKNGGDFPGFLLKLTLKAFRKKYGQETFDYMVYVPPTESGDLVKNFAEKLSRALKIPISHKLIKTSETQPQKALNNHYLKKENVSDKFGYTAPNELTGKSIILFDDIFDSGATIREIGRVLTKFGAGKIAPLVIARTVGGDIKKQK